MAENAAASSDKGKSSASAPQPKSEPPPFYITESGTESISVDEKPAPGPPITARDDFEQAPTGNEEEEPAAKPEGKTKGDGEFDKQRQQFDQEAANTRRQNQELTARVEDLGKQLADALEHIKTPPKPEPEQIQFKQLGPDSDVDDIVEALNQLGKAQFAGNDGELAQTVSKLQKQFEQDRTERAQATAISDRQSYLADMGTFLDAGEKDYGKKARTKVEEVVAAEMTRRGYNIDRLPDMYTLELAIEKAFLEASGGRKKRGTQPPPNTVALDSGTGGSPDSSTNSFEPQTLNDWTADAKRRAAAGKL